MLQLIDSRIKERHAPRLDEHESGWFSRRWHERAHLVVLFGAPHCRMSAVNVGPFDAGKRPRVAGVALPDATYDHHNGFSGGALYSKIQIDQACACTAL